MSVRTLVVWCPDWPVVAAAAGTGLAVDTPMAVMSANRVVACSAQARTEGVRRGMRRRDAQGRCPELVVFADDPARDARLFEPVACAVEDLAAGVEVVRPGLAAVPARGPAGYFGGDVAAAERLTDHVAARAETECQIGIADSLFAAVLAAYRARLIPPGETGDFLAPLGIWELTRLQDTTDINQLVDLLRRLGIRTLGAFSQIPERDIASRFGAVAVAAHRLAAGRQQRPPALRRPPPEFAVTSVLDPPVDRIDAAAFAGRGLATRLHDGLAAHGVACTRLAIHATTESGQERIRVWRSAEPLTAAGIADRVRWQLEGWLRGDGEARPNSGISVLRVEPVDIVEGTALQLGLYSQTDDNSERAARSMVRVQGLLGADAVCIPVFDGGRGPVERVRLVPWGDERVPRRDPTQPWPGRLPAPSPTLVAGKPVPAGVFDADGGRVEVTETGEFTAAPARVSVRDGAPRTVVGWAGPWPVDERWWSDGRRRDRLQVVLRDPATLHDPTTPLDQALLLVWENGSWAVEGSYD